MSNLDKASEFTNFSKTDLAEKLPEITTFHGSEKRLSNFETRLPIRHTVVSIDSFFLCSLLCNSLRKNRR